MLQTQETIVLSYGKEISLVWILLLTMLIHEQFIKLGVDFEKRQELFSKINKKKDRKRGREEKEKIYFKSVTQMQ